MSAVTGIKSATSTTAATGLVNVTTTQPGLLGITTNGTSLNFAPTQTAVNSFNGKSGAVTLGNTDGSLGVAFVPAFSANAILTSSTANTALASVQNLSGAGVWVSGTHYYKGATVFSVVAPTNLFIATADIPSSTTDPGINSTDWLFIASTGGGGATNSISGGGASIACDDPTGSGAITVTTTYGTAPDMNINTKDVNVTADNINVTNYGNITMNSANAGGQTTMAFQARSSELFLSLENNPYVIEAQVLNRGTATILNSIVIDGNGSNAPNGYKGLWVGTSNLSYNEAVISGSSIQNLSNTGSFSIDPSGNTISITPNNGLFNIGDCSATPTYATAVQLGSTSELKMLNSGSNDSAAITFFTSQSNDAWVNLNTTDVSGYTAPIGSTSLLTVQGGGGTLHNAYGDFGVGSLQVLGTSAAPLVPIAPTSVPYLTASTNISVGPPTQTLTLSAGGVGNSSNFTSVSVVADTLTGPFATFNSVTVPARGTFNSGTLYPNGTVWNLGNTFFTDLANTHPVYLDTFPIVGLPPGQTATDGAALAVTSSSDPLLSFPYADLVVGRSIIAGLNDAIAPATGFSLPYITTIQGSSPANFNLEINAGLSNVNPINFVSPGLLLNGNAIELTNTTLQTSDANATITGARVNVNPLGELVGYSVYTFPVPTNVGVNGNMSGIFSCSVLGYFGTLPANISAAIELSDVLNGPPSGDLRTQTNFVPIPSPAANTQYNQNNIYFQFQYSPGTPTATPLTELYLTLLLTEPTQSTPTTYTVTMESPLIVFNSLPAISPTFLASQSS